MSLYAPASQYKYTDLTRGDNLIATGEGVFSDRLIGANGTVTGLSTQTIYLVYFTAIVSEQVSQVTTYTGSTPSSGASFAKVGMYYVSNAAGDLNILWTTANDAAMWSAANTAYTKPLTDPSTGGKTTLWHKVRGCRYACAFMSVASTRPTMVGVVSASGSPFTAIYNKQPRIASVYNTGPPSDFPSNIADSALTSSIDPKFIYAELTP